MNLYAVGVRVFGIICYLDVSINHLLIIQHKLVTVLSKITRFFKKASLLSLEVLIMRFFTEIIVPSAK